MKLDETNPQNNVTFLLDQKTIPVRVFNEHEDHLFLFYYDHLNINFDGIQNQSINGILKNLNACAQIWI